MWKRLALLSAVLFVAPTLEAVAAGSSRSMPAVSTQSEAERLDSLFAELKRSRSDKAAARVAARIQAEWMKSGSASIDLMMQWAGEGIEDRNFAMALDFLDQIVVLEPGFSEGYSRRAAVHFMMNDYAKALRDLARALELEPRRYDVLTGMAAIMRSTGSKASALDAYQKALEIYPMLRDAQKEAASLSEELAGEAI